MSGPIFGAVLVLAWFGTSNLALSLVASALGRLVSARRIAERPDGAAWMLFALTVAPAAISVFFTFGIFIPAQWRWEPPQTQESAGYSIALCASVGAAIAALTFARALRDTRATSTIARRWRTAAREDGCRRGLGLPILFLADRSPVMSLVGIFRPAVFVAEEVEAELTPEELEVSLAHEAAHARAGDNLKRLVAAWCPDALGLFGRDLAARWRAATEFAADASAVAGSETRAVALASALLKVARLTPEESCETPLAVSRIHHQALLAARVERLLRPADRVPASRRGSWSWLLAAMMVVTIAAVVAAHDPSLTVHQVTEGLIRVLP